MGRYLLLMVVGVSSLAACGPKGDAAHDAAVDVADDALHDADEAATGDADGAAELPCTALFGRPNEKTGLTGAQCRPACDCEGRLFEPPTYTEAQLVALEAMALLQATTFPAEDPYQQADVNDIAPGAVCGVRLDAGREGGYRLQTYPSRQAALDDGAVPSHEGACGLCSPLVNLAVYMRHPDLTDPVRACGIASIGGGKEEHLACLMELGFDEPCATIWYYNTKHTQERCGAVCFSLLDAPYHLPDGSLNACLVCDEEESGPVFKAVAGRTRRNTGLPSSMCRPCAEVEPFVHVYGKAE